MISYQVSEIFRPFMFSGERILWSGQPKQGIALTGRDAYLIPFSLLWGGFAIFWNVGVWSFPDTGDGPDWFFRLWGLPFLVAGLYLIVGRFFHDAAIRKSLRYAVTDQRILVRRGTRSSKLTSLDVHRLPMLELSEFGDGSGTITFDSSGGGTFGSGRNGFDWWVPSLRSSAQFFRIDNPRSVYDLIRNQSRQ